MHVYACIRLRFFDRDHTTEDDTASPPTCLADALLAQHKETEVRSPVGNNCCNNLQAVDIFDM
jgi:hypothetical protein